MTVLLTRTCSAVCDPFRHALFIAAYGSESVTGILDPTTHTAQNDDTRHHDAHLVLRDPLVIGGGCVCVCVSQCVGVWVCVCLCVCVCVCVRFNE